MVSKMVNFKRIGIFTSSYSKATSLVSRQIEEILVKREAKFCLIGRLKARKTDEPLRPIQLIFLKNCDLIIAIGGDGAMLSYSRLYGSKGIHFRDKPWKTGLLDRYSAHELTTKLMEVFEGR